jgi:flagellar hook-length control protein FliK
VAAPVTPAVDPAGAAAATALTAGAAAATPATGTIAPPSTAAQAAAGVLAAQSGSAEGAAPTVAACAPADGVPAGKLQLPAELSNAKGGHTKDFKNGDQPQRELPPAPTLAPTADAAAAPTSATAPTPPADPGAAITPAPTVATQAQPAAPPQTAVPVASGAPQLTRASVLQTAERVQELVRIATTRAGTARAVLQLRPAELGQVDVHLRTTRNGLVATIAAHEQVGLDALQQAGNELRRTLEDKGVQLHSLDLQLGDGRNSFFNQSDAREASSGRRGAVATHGLGSDDDLVASDELTITHAPSTPAGALVDVQA